MPNLHLQVPPVLTYLLQPILAVTADGTTLSGIGALIGGIATLIAAVAAVFKGKSWIHAFRSKIDLVTERDTLSAFGKRLMQENMSATKAAEGWKQAYEAVHVQHEALVQSNRDLVKAVNAAMDYIRQLYEHSLRLEQKMRQNNVPIDIKLPPLPVDLQQVPEQVQYQQGVVVSAR